MAAPAPARLQPVDVGDPSTPLLRVIGNNAVVAELFRTMTDVLVRRSRLPARTRWLVTIRMAARCGCGYAFGRHGAEAAQPGLRDAALASPDASDLADDDRAILQLVDQLYETNDVDDALWARLAERWNPSELVELVSLAGLYWMASAVANVSRGDELAE